MVVGLAVAIASIHSQAPAGGPPCSCFGDLNGNASVDGADLGLLLAAWGDDFPGDLDDSGTIDGADLGLLLAAWGPCPAPVNDACSEAIQIGNSGFIPFCTTNATTFGPSVSNQCGTAATQVHRDIWYEYFAEGSGTLGVSTCGYVEFDSVIAAYSSILPGLNLCPPADGSPTLSTLVDCNDDLLGCGNLASKLEIEVTQGYWYKIRVGAFLDSGGEGELDIDFTSVGDGCTRGIDVLGQVGASKTIVGITTDNPHFELPCNGGVNSGGEWITYTPPPGGAVVSLSTCHPATDYDTVLAVYREAAGSCTGLFVGCNDDSLVPECALEGSLLKSKLTFVATAGQIYHIVVSGFSGAEGAYQLTIASN